MAAAKIGGAFAAGVAVGLTLLNGLMLAIEPSAHALLWVIR